MSENGCQFSLLFGDDVIFASKCRQSGKEETLPDPAMGREAEEAVNAVIAAVGGDRRK